MLKVQVEWTSSTRISPSGDSLSGEQIRRMLDTRATCRWLIQHTSPAHLGESRSGRRDGRTDGVMHSFLVRVHQAPRKLSKAQRNSSTAQSQSQQSHCSAQLRAGGCVCAPCPAFFHTVARGERDALVRVAALDQLDRGLGVVLPAAGVRETGVLQCAHVAATHTDKRTRTPEM